MGLNQIQNMKTNPILKSLCAGALLTLWAAWASAGEAAWNISTMGHEPTPTTSDKGWTGAGLTIEEKEGKLVVRPAASSANEANKIASIQRYAQRTPGFNWLVLKIDEMTRPDSGYIYFHLMLNAKVATSVITMAGNVPHAAFFTLKLPESPETQGVLRLDSTMNELVISDLGLYEAPLPRLEFVMPDTSDEMVPASSEFSVELRLDAPAQSVSISLFDGRATISILFSPGQPSLDLEAADVEKKIWRGKFSFAGAVFRGQAAAEQSSMRGGQLLIKATVEGTDGGQEIWTANSRGIDLAK
jgi:hypothetical protein